MIPWPCCCKKAFSISDCKIISSPTIATILSITFFYAKIKLKEKDKTSNNKTFFMCINLLLYSQNLRPLNYYFYSKQRRTVESLVNFYILFTNSFFIDLFFQVVFELKFLLIFQNKGNFISDII